MIHSMLKRSFVAVLVGCSAMLGPVQVARAELISTEEAVRSDAATAERAELRAWLGREEMRTQLRALGVDAAEAKARIDSLSDQEVLEVRERLDQMPAGEGFVGAVVGVVVVTAAVILFTDLLGYTDVYPFIRPLPRASGSSANASDVSGSDVN